MWNYNYTYSDELYHYGRLGMKWGQHIFGLATSGTYRDANRYAKKAEKHNKAAQSIRSQGSSRNNRDIAKIHEAAGGTAGATYGSSQYYAPVNQHLWENGVYASSLKIKSK